MRMDKSCCWKGDFSAPMARPPSATRGAILRGRASVVSLGIERASTWPFTWVAACCRLPGHRESVGMPASRQALVCFCERVLRA